MRQIVYFVKPDKAQAFEAVLRHLPPMPTENDELRYREEICARVKELRKRSGWTAEQMAIALNVPAYRYSKYETRTPLPGYLMERFALITGVSVEFLVTGRASREVPQIKAGQSRG